MICTKRRQLEDYTSAAGARRSLREQCRREATQGQTFQSDWCRFEKVAK